MYMNRSTMALFTRNNILNHIHQAYWPRVFDKMLLQW